MYSHNDIDKEGAETAKDHILWLARLSLKQLLAPPKGWNSLIYTQPSVHTRLQLLTRVRCFVWAAMNTIARESQQQYLLFCGNGSHQYTPSVRNQQSPFYQSWNERTFNQNTSEYQRDTISAVLNAWDVIVCLPMSQGKSLSNFNQYPGATNFSNPEKV